MSDNSMNARHTAPSTTDSNTGPEQHQWTTASGARVKVINHAPSTKGFSGDNVSVYDWNEQIWKEVQKGDEAASLAMVLGNTSIYVFGLAWLAFVIAFQSINPELTYYDAIKGSNVLDKTLRAGLYPFIGGDALKLLLAAMVLPGAWDLVRRVKGK